MKTLRRELNRGKMKVSILIKVALGDRKQERRWLSDRREEHNYQ